MHSEIHRDAQYTAHTSHCTCLFICSQMSTQNMSTFRTGKWASDTQSHYYELFDQIGKWAWDQPWKGLWDAMLNTTFQTSMDPGKTSPNWWRWRTEPVEIRVQKIASQPWPGHPVDFPSRRWLERDIQPPPDCSPDIDESFCGVSEEADLITLNPIFDADGSGWVFSQDLTGYDINLPIPPHQTANFTAGRLSRKLPSAMHNEMVQFGHSTFSKTFPPTMALHHGLKAVCVPHPVYFDRKWPLKEVCSGTSMLEVR
jgi:hypothetical protein